MNANVSRVWNDCGTGLRRRPSWPRGPAEAASGARTSAISALGELVAGTADGQDELRQRRVVLDLVAQVADVDVDRLLVLVEGLVVAQQLQQLAAAEDAARAAGEVAEDLELGRREPDPAVAPLDPPPLEVDDAGRRGG